MLLKYIISFCLFVFLTSCGKFTETSTITHKPDVVITSNGYMVFSEYLSLVVPQHIDTNVKAELSFHTSSGKIVCLYNSSGESITCQPNVIVYNVVEIMLLAPYGFARAQLERR